MDNINYYFSMKHLKGKWGKALFLKGKNRGKTSIQTNKKQGPE
jgi:hypothetical protein